MSAKKASPEAPATDAELDALTAQLEEQKQLLTAPKAGTEAAPAIDPASILAIINVVMALIDWWRNRNA